MDRAPLPDAFDPLGIVAGLTGHGVSYVLVGELAAQSQGAQTQADRVDICVPGDQRNLIRLSLALEQLGARQRSSGSQDDHHASFDTQLGRLDLVESDLEFASLDANASRMNLGRGAEARVASLADLARWGIYTEVAPVTAPSPAQGDGFAAGPPAKSLKPSLGFRRSKAPKADKPPKPAKPEKAPKAPKAPKPPKAPKAPKAAKEPRSPKAEKAEKPAKPAKPEKTEKPEGENRRLVDRVLEKLEGVDTFLTDVNSGKRSVGRKK